MMHALTNGWSFLQALRSCDSLLRAIPDITAHQRLPVEKQHKAKQLFASCVHNICKLCTQ